jgi:hypothetical protein
MTEWPGGVNALYKKTDAENLVLLSIYRIAITNLVITVNNNNYFCKGTPHSTNPNFPGQGQVDLVSLSHIA